MVTVNLSYFLIVLPNCVLVQSCYYFIIKAPNSGTRYTVESTVEGNSPLSLLYVEDEPAKGVYMFRPGLIQPLHGIKSKTVLYRILYLHTGPFIPLLKSLLPKTVTTTEQVGRAMIRIRETRRAETAARKY